MQRRRTTRSYTRRGGQILQAIGTPWTVQPARQHHSLRGQAGERRQPAQRPHEGVVLLHELAWR